MDDSGWDELWDSGLPDEWQLCFGYSTFAFLPGDIDGNGRLSPADISATIDARLGNVEYTQEQLFAVDFDRSAALDPSDISVMIDYRLGTITEWP